MGHSKNPVESSVHPEYGPCILNADCSSCRALTMALMGAKGLKTRCNNKPQHRPRSRTASSAASCAACKAASSTWAYGGPRLPFHRVRILAAVSEARKNGNPIGPTFRFRKGKGDWCFIDCWLKAGRSSAGCRELLHMHGVGTVSDASAACVTPCQGPRPKASADLVLKELSEVPPLVAPGVQLGL